MSASATTEDVTAQLTAANAKIETMQRLIAEAQHELQYAQASNCPLHWVKIAQQKLKEATA